ncbi:hypothetical protein FB451DRAFT_1231458, partial [Mycena latifolia]
PIAGTMPHFERVAWCRFRRRHCAGTYSIFRLWLLMCPPLSRSTYICSSVQFLALRCVFAVLPSKDQRVLNP